MHLKTSKRVFTSNSETWTIYRPHVKQLDQFHLRCLRSICRIKWQDMIPNTEVLEKCEMPGIESMLIKSQLRWAGHVMRMNDKRIPKAVFCAQLKEGKRNPGRPRLRYRDTLKNNLGVCNITNWQQTLENRAAWRTAIHTGTQRFEKDRLNQLKEKRQRRKNPNTINATFVCNICDRKCLSQIGLISHKRTHKP